MSMYRLPHGQYGYKGHVINLPQEVGSFATSLPRKPSELDIILVRKEGSQNSHHDFRVRKSVVLNALQWLKENNKYYRDITIDQSTLDSLPDDGDMTGLCGVMMEMPVVDEEDLQPSDEADPSDVSTFVPVVGKKRTEQENIEKSVQ